MEKTEFSIQIDTAEQKKMSEEPMKQEEAVSEVHEELEKQEPLIELRNIYKIYYMGDEDQDRGLWQNPKKLSRYRAPKCFMIRQALPMK